MKKFLIAGAAIAVSALALAAPARAMGSGDSYVDTQVGVTYTVYEPMYTNGLPLTNFTTANFTASCQAEAVIEATYAKKGRSFTIFEGNPICMDLGVGPTVSTTTIDGATATITAYCMPGTRCSMKDVARYGGHLSVMLPAANSQLRPTQVWIETLKGSSVGGNELVKIAQRMMATADMRNDWNNGQGNQGWNGGGNQGWNGGSSDGNQGFNGGSNNGNQGFQN